MYKLTVMTQFSAAHRLEGYEGQCERLHGHNYRVELLLGCEELNEAGMVMDFKDVKGMAENIIQRFDHTYLNEVEPFDVLNPTAEQIARHIAEQVAGRLPEGIRVLEATCWESDRCSASYVP